MNPALHSMLSDNARQELAFAALALTRATAALRTLHASTTANACDEMVERLLLAGAAVDGDDLQEAFSNALAQFDDWRRWLGLDAPSEDSCARCSGFGSITENEMVGDGRVSHTFPCPRCNDR